MLITSRGDEVQRMLHSLSLLLLLFSGAGGLRDVRVSVPEAAAAGDTVSLQCRYDLEQDVLYSVKWYKGREEFFRYIPKELPHTRVFAVLGVDVDVGRSGPATVVLRSVLPSQSGRYRCEVSADAPSFHTTMKTSYMHVVEVPLEPPLLVAERSRVAPGELLRAQCSAPAAHPPANLTWMLNGHTINATTLEHIPSETTSYKRSPKASENTISQYSTNSTSSGENVNNASIAPKYRRPNNDPFLQPTSNSSGDNSEGSWEGVPGVYSKQMSKSDVVVKKRSVSTLVLGVQQEFLQQGALKLTCKATLFSLYSAQAELLLTAERPQTAQVLVLATGHTHSRSHLSSGSCAVIFISIIFSRIWIREQIGRWSIT